MSPRIKQIDLENMERNTYNWIRFHIVMEGIGMLLEFVKRHACLIAERAGVAERMCTWNNVFTSIVQL